MRQVFLAEITAYDPREDELVTLRMCSGGQGHVAFPEFPNDHYIPCIASAPSQTRTVTENGIPGQISIDYGSITIRFTPEHRNTHWRRYDFDGYACRLLYGEYGAPYSTYKQIPAGRVGSLDVQAVNLGELALLGPDVELKKDILTASYLGTGGAEGADGAKGILKPFAIGRCENIEALLIDPVNLIWQYHGYGPTKDVEAVYENALTLGSPKFIAATYEQLAGYTAEQLPPGTWAKAPAVGMFRFGGEPIGKVTADVVGALDGSSVPTSVGAICAYMLRNFGGIAPALIDTTSASKMDREFPHTWGSYIDARSKPEGADENEPSYSVGDFVREATSHLAGYLFADALGVWHFGRNVSTKAPIVLRSGRSSKPAVIDITSPATSTRVHRVRVGGRRCFSVHSDSEISSALKDAVEGTLEVIGGVKQDVKEANDNANSIRQQLPDLVGPLLKEPINQISSLQLKYGAAQFNATMALHNQNLVAIRALGTRIDEDGNAVAEDILQLTTRVGDAESGLLTLNKTVAGLDFATSETVEIQIANFGKGVTAAINEERRVRVEKDLALAEDVKQMGVRITKEVGDAKTDYNGQFTDIRKLVVDSTAGTIKAEDLDRIDLKLTKAIGDETTTREVAISNAREAWIEGDRVVAQTVNELGSRVTREVNGVKTETEAAIRDGLKTVVDEAGAATEAVRNLSSSYNGLVGPNGVIQIIQETEAKNNSARAEETKNLQSKVDSMNYAGLEQSFKTYADKTDKIGAQYVLKAQTVQNGVITVAGMGLAIEDGVSAIAFNADSFRINTPGETGKQIFYGDADGIYMPNVRVDKLTYGALVDQFAKNSSVNDPNSGYIQIPGGPMIMWGKYRAAIRGEVSVPVTFPVPFPTMCVSFNVTPYIATPNYRKDLWVQNTGSPSRFGSTVYTQAATGDDQYLDGFDWMAVGI